MKLLPGPRRTLAVERNGQAAAACGRGRDGRRHVPAERRVAGQGRGAPRQARRIPAAMARREHQRRVLQREGAPARRRVLLLPPPKPKPKPTPGKATAGQSG